MSNPEGSRRLSKVELSEMSGTTLVLLTANWCSFSKNALPVITSLDSKLIDRTILLDFDENTDFCDSVNIKCIPTMIIAKNGSIAEAISGSSNIENITKSLNSYLKLIN